MAESIHAIETLLSPIASRLLVRSNSAWTGEDAKKLVKATLMATRRQVSKAEFQKLVANSYRVGKALGSVDNINKSAPWDIAALRDSLKGFLAVRPNMSASEAFVTQLAATVKSYDFDIPQSTDWIDVVKRVARSSERDDASIDLSARIELADHILELLDERLSAMVSVAERELDILAEEVRVALADALATYKQQAETRNDTKSNAARSNERLTNIELEDLVESVHARCRSAFKEWVARLSPVAQQATRRRVLQLRSDPLIYRLWVKQIHGPRTEPLFELKVISERTHYRLLFRTSGNEITIGAFGLRRDLESLIALADGLT